jgi:hypothetical protein
MLIQVSLSPQLWLRTAKCISLALITASIAAACDERAEPTTAAESAYNDDIRGATTSTGLSKADLAWHAQNTYGWDCSEVVSVGETNASGYFLIECSSGERLRVYPRVGQHPKITNENGGYN